MDEGQRRQADATRDEELCEAIDTITGRRADYTGVELDGVESHSTPETEPITADWAIELSVASATRPRSSAATRRDPRDRTVSFYRCRISQLQRRYLAAAIAADAMRRCLSSSKIDHLTHRRTGFQLRKALVDFGEPYAPRDQMVELEAPLFPER
jgi:hypothetical protein